MRRDTVVWDLGGVLIDWNPRHLYRRMFDDEAAMERFLAEICTPEWNLQQDAGRSFAEATAALAAEHPGEAALIEDYWTRWPEMLAGPIEGSVAILQAQHEAGTPLYALTNWSAETFVHAESYAFLAWFRGIVVSGRERMVKPDPAIFRLLLDRHGLTAARTVYIDDNEANAAAAATLGLHAIRFTTPAALALDLAALGLPATSIRGR